MRWRLELQDMRIRLQYRRMSLWALKYLVGISTTSVKGGVAFAQYIILDFTTRWLRRHWQL
jgi:hypothetical protein